MDAYFASIEQRDFPHLKGKPVIVGGSPNSRGVVSTCSYEARRFGVHSAMPSALAKKICPQGIFVRGRFEAYQTCTKQIREIFYSFTELVEPMSLDEAYLDLTFSDRNSVSIAQEIKKKIFEKTKITASAGVSYNKFLAKIASDYNKPDGLTIITKENAIKFLDNLPLRKFHGIGKSLSSKLLNQGFKSGGDLRKLSKMQINSFFGKSGDYFYNICRGIDNRPVVTERIRKSAGHEVTFDEDIKDLNSLDVILRKLAEKISERMIKHKILGQSITIKFKYFDFQVISRIKQLDSPINSKEDVYLNALALLKKNYDFQVPLRLLGIALGNLINEDEFLKKPRQLHLNLF